jgi:hypothetical protein
MKRSDKRSIFDGVAMPLAVVARSPTVHDNRGVRAVDD